MISAGGIPAFQMALGSSPVDLFGWEAAGNDLLTGYVALGPVRAAVEVTHEEAGGGS